MCALLCKPIITDMNLFVPRGASSISQNNIVASICCRRLKELRLRHGLSQGQLARLVGVTQEAVSQYELDKGTPRYSVLVLIAKILDTTTDYLLGAAEETKIPQPETFSEREQRVIAEFRQLSPTAQERAIGYLHGAKDNQAT